MQKFNSYIEKEELSVLKELCLRQGQVTHLRKKDFFCRQGEAVPYVAYIEKGILRYTCLNDKEGKEYSVGFTLTNEFVADYPGCLYGIPSEVNIQAATDCTLHYLPTGFVKRFFEDTPQRAIHRKDDSRAIIPTGLSTAAGHLPENSRRTLPGPAGTLPQHSGSAFPA